MVLKKDAEVQDGWVGHVLPFELVQSVKMHEEVAALRGKRKLALPEIAGEYESYLDRTGARRTRNRILSTMVPLLRLRSKRPSRRGR